MPADSMSMNSHSRIRAEPAPRFASDLSFASERQPTATQPNLELEQQTDRLNQMRSSLHQERLATFTGQGKQPPQSQPRTSQPLQAPPSQSKSQLNRSTVSSNGSLVERSKDLFSTARVVLSQDAFDGFLATIRALNDKKLGQAEALER